MGAHLTRALAALLLATLSPPSLGAQEPAPLEVRVVDGGSGAPVEGALVRVVGTPLFVTTDADGRARLVGLDGGRWTLAVSAAGFADEAHLEIETPATESVELRLERKVLDLPGLVVTAGRGTQRFGRTSASVDVIDDRQLERLGALTVDEGLRFASGVVFNHGQPDIRGATGLARGVGSRVLFLLDGHRFLSGTTGGVSFETIPSLGTERIEIVKGPASTLYGSAALGGVVNVIRKPVPDHPETVVRAHVGVFDTPDDFDFTDATLSYQGIDVRHARPLGPVDAFVEVGRRTSDGYRQNGGFERTLYHAGLVLPRDEGPARVQLFITGSSGEEGRFFQWAAEDRPLEVEPEALGDRIHVDEWSVSATIVPIADETTLLTIRPGAYGADVRNDLHDSEDFHESIRWAVDTELALHGWEGHVVTAGVEGAVTPVRSNILGEPEIQDWAVYLQDELDVSPRLRASAGLRLDHHATDPGSSEVRLNPRIGTVWSPSDRVHWRASLGRGYRAPSAAEQFVSTTRSGFDVIPNLDLRGESSWSFEVGGSGRLRSWLWVDLGLFESRFDDLIEPSPVPGRLFTFQFRNVQEARVRGIDLSARLGVPDERIGGRVGYLLLDADDLRRDLALPYRSKHQITASLDWGPLGVDVEHRSRVERVLVFPLDPREAITLLGVRAGFRVAGVEGRLRVSNLLQETYVDVQERNLGPSRSFQLVVSSTF